MCIFFTKLSRECEHSTMHEPMGWLPKRRPREPTWILLVYIIYFHLALFSPQIFHCFCCHSIWWNSGIAEMFPVAMDGLAHTSAHAEFVCGGEADESGKLIWVSWLEAGFHWYQCRPPPPTLAMCLRHLNIHVQEKTMCSNVNEALVRWQSPPQSPTNRIFLIIQLFYIYVLYK